MNKPDKFTLYTGIFGLIADAIGLIVIYDQYRNPNITDKPISNLVHLLIFFLYVYGWFILSWIFFRGKLQKKNTHDETEKIMPFLIGLGIIFVPLVGLWLNILIGNAITNIVFLNIVLDTIFAIALNLIVGLGILFSVMFLAQALIDE